MLEARILPILTFYGYTKLQYPLGLHPKAVDTKQNPEKSQVHQN